MVWWCLDIHLEIWGTQAVMHVRWWEITRMLRIISIAVVGEAMRVL